MTFDRFFHSLARSIGNLLLLPLLMPPQPQLQLQPPQQPSSLSSKSKRRLLRQAEREEGRVSTYIVDIGSRLISPFSILSLSLIFICLLASLSFSFLTLTLTLPLSFSFSFFYCRSQTLTFARAKAQSKHQLTLSSIAAYLTILALPFFSPQLDK